MAYRARYAGTCRRCGKAINVGDYISWSRGRNKAVYHTDCEIEPKPSPMPTDWGEPNQYTQPTEKPITVDTEDTDMPEPKHEVPAVEEALQILLKALKPAAPTLDKSEVRKIVEEIVSEKGVITLKIERPEMPDIQVDNAHHMLGTLIKYVAKRRHTYLYGPPGSGKSTAARQAAEALGLPYYYIAITPQTPESRLMGYKDANGNYHETDFRRAYEHGGVFNIEEADNGGGNLQTSLNSAFENGHCAFPDRMVERHKNFVVVATGNTCGRGASPLFPERRPFDQAFAKRFSYIYWGYDEKLERQIALAINESADVWITWMKKLRDWAEQSKATLIVSPRETFRVVEDLKDGFPVDIALNAALWNGNWELKDKALANVPLPV